MGYEELTIHAIQKQDEKSFDGRFRRFTTKAERDRTYEFMMKNSTPLAASQLCPVTLKIIVKTEDVQLDLFDQQTKR